jgi:RHS repeat-associated protein
MTSKHDHLGSARITLDNAARVIESQSYTAYGDHRTHDGQASRTSYIGRETDKESDLGFNGVRLYDPTYGRFLSVDPLWSKYLPYSAYQYCRNNPISRIDDTGLWDITVTFMKSASRTDAPFGVATVTDANGKEVMSFVVRGEGVGGRDRMKSNSDTPQGEYSIDGWITPTADERVAYGPNPRLALTGVSGEITESGRSLIRVHGGRQEEQLADGSWKPIPAAELKPTHGCLRASDADMKRLKAVTGGLTKANPEDKPGKLTVDNAITAEDENKPVEKQDD